MPTLYDVRRRAAAAASQAGRELSDLELSVYPAAIAFHLLLCAGPFLLLLFSGFGYFLSNEEAFAKVADFVLQMLPSKVQTPASGSLLTGSAVRNVLRSVVEGRTIVGIVGLTFLLLTASGLMASMRTVLNDVFKVKDRKHPALVRIYDLAVFGLIGVIVIAANIMLLLLPLLDRWTLGLLNWFDRLVHPLLHFAMFYALYRFLPTRRAPHGTAVASSASFVVLWGVARRIVGWVFAKEAGNYSVVYGASALFVVTGIWLYYSALLFTVCAVIGRAIHSNLREA